MKLRRESEDGQYFLDVTDYVKPIVGSILNKAEIEIDDYHSPEEAEDIAKQFLQTCASGKRRKNLFTCDASTLHLYFKDKGGIRDIVFSNSEWGEIYNEKTTERVEEQTGTLSSMSDERLRTVYLSLKVSMEDSITLDNDILTIAYLTHPEDNAAAISLFLEDIKQEILDRFLYLN